MARDYKDRSENRGQRTRRGRSTGEQTDRWLLILALGVIFIALISYLKTTTDKTTATQVARVPNLATPTPTPQPTEVKKIEPEFSFYTLLTNEEVTIPDQELKIRQREELQGKGKKNIRYSVQAGAFRQFADADRLKAELALLGLAAKIEKAKVGEVVWSRVKLGPYAQLDSVAKIKARLREASIDVVVTEEAAPPPITNNVLQ